MTCNPQIFTVPANTNDHDINFDSFCEGTTAVASIFVKSGASGVRFNNTTTTDASNSYAYLTTDAVVRLSVQKGRNFHFRGGAGSETFVVNIINAGA